MPTRPISVRLKPKYDKLLRERMARTGETATEALEHFLELGAQMERMEYTLDEGLFKALFYLRYLTHHAGGDELVDAVEDDYNAQREDVLEAIKGRYRYVGHHQ